MEKVESDILEMLLRFRNKPPNVVANEEWTAFESYVSNLVKDHGWNRDKIYKCMIKIFHAHRGTLPENSLDALDGYITSLTGEVAPECFARFPGEPDKPDQFVEYVRSRAWMRDEK